MKIFKKRMYGGLVSTWLVVTLLFVSMAGLVDAQVRRPSAAFQSITVAGKALFANGTASAPSMAFISAPTLGFYKGTPTQINLEGDLVVSGSGGNGLMLTAGVLRHNSNFVLTTNNSGNITLSPSGTGQVILSIPAITSGSGTGLTVNVTSAPLRVVHKVTIDFTALSAAGLTADKTIATLPAKMRLVGIIADTTIKYIGGAVTAATLIVGKTVGGNEYIVSHDVFAAAITKGLLDADLGTSINRANAIQGGDLPSWTGTTDISVRLTTVTANTNALTQGSTTYYLITEVMP